jgi:hypothetical protein
MANFNRVSGFIGIECRTPTNWMVNSSFIRTENTYKLIVSDQLILLGYGEYKHRCYQYQWVDVYSNVVDVVTQRQLHGPCFTDLVYQLHVVHHRLVVISTIDW